MNWLFPSVIATLTGTLALAAIYSYLAVSEKQPFMRKWALGWWVYACRFVFMLSMIVTGPKALLIIGNQASSLISGVFLLWGTCEFLNRRMGPVWFVLSGIILAWIVFGTLSALTFWAFAIPTFFFLGAIYIWSGLSFLRAAPIKGFGASLTGYSFVFWGLHKIDYPFLRPLDWFAPWGYLLASLFEMLVALGILLTYFQKNKAELQKTLKDLKVQQHLLGKSQEMAHLGSWHLDHKANLLTWSAEVYRILGRSPREFQPTIESFIEAVHPDDRRMVNQTYQQAVSHKIPFECIHRIRRPDGEIRTVLEKSEDVIDEHGEAVQTFGYTQDITELTEAEENFRLIAETINEVFWLGSPDWKKVHYISPAYEEIWGRSCRSLYEEPLSWLDGVHPDEREAVMTEIRRKVEGKSRSPEFPEYRVVHPDGSVRWVFARSYPVYAKDGGIRSIAGIAEDITERRLAQDELKKHQARLEGQVRKRTEELQFLVNAMSGRELRMAELKRIIRKLRQQLQEAGITPVADD